MKGLDKLFVLASKVTVFVPATVHTDKASSNAAQVKATAELLTQLFGGATSSAAIGYWKSAISGLVKEKTTIVFAYCGQEALEANIEQLIEHCNTMKKAMDQESIALEVNGSMYFV